MRQIDTIEDFESLLEKADDNLVVVDFYAKWCGPCKKMEPFLSSLSKKYDSTIFVKVDVDVNEEVSGLLQVDAMPTFILFKNGRKITKIEGADRKKLESKIKKHVTESSSE